MYVRILHGGGATSVTQTNDTDNHQTLKRKYIGTEMEWTVNKSRRTGDCMPTPTPQDCIGFIAEAWSDPQLHADAAKGFKRTGCLNNLDGTEDDEIVREAGYFWNHLKMGKKRDAMVHFVKAEVAAGRLKWTPEDINGLIPLYPKTGKMDKLEEFMDDEYPALEDGEQAYLSDDEDEEGDDSSDDSKLGEASSQEDACSASDLGEGSSAQLAVTDEEAIWAHGLNERLRVYDEAKELMRSISDRAAMVNLDRAIHTERRRMRATKAAPVLRALHDKITAENEECVKSHREAMQQREEAAKRQRLEKSAKALEERVRKANKAIKDAQDIAECSAALKNYAPEGLGQGKKNGGGEEFKKRRYEVMERIALRGCPLTSQQRNDWKWFKPAWDAKMAPEHDKAWGITFAGMMKGILEKLEEGAASAVVDFMYSEIQRVLPAAEVLRI